MLFGGFVQQARRGVSQVAAGDREAQGGSHGPSQDHVPQQTHRRCPVQFEDGGRSGGVVVVAEEELCWSPQLRVRGLRAVLQQHRRLDPAGCGISISISWRNRRTAH